MPGQSASPGAPAGRPPTARLLFLVPAALVCLATLTLGRGVAVLGGSRLPADDAAQWQLAAALRRVVEESGQAVEPRWDRLEAQQAQLLSRQERVLKLVQALGARAPGARSLAAAAKAKPGHVVSHALQQFRKSKRQPAKPTAPAGAALPSEYKPPATSVEAALQRMRGKFAGRFDWCDLLNSLNERAASDPSARMRRGAEIGVWKGDFATVALTTIPGLEEYVLVDPWAHQPAWNKPFNVNDTQFSAIFDEAMSRTRDLPDVGGKVSVLRYPSVEAARRVEDGSLDFVYIDGDHTAKGVTIDLVSWVRKVRSGGLVAGDDFVEGQHVRNGFAASNVRPVAIGYAAAMGAQIYDMGGGGPGEEPQFGFVVP